MGKGGVVDVRECGRMDYLEDLSNLPKRWPNRPNRAKFFSKNVAVAWDVPLKTGPEKAPKCTKGFYSGATPKWFSKEP